MQGFGGKINGPNGGLAPPAREADKDATHFRQAVAPMTLLDHDPVRAITLAMDHIPQGIAVFDAGLRLVASNQRYNTLLHLPPDLVRPGSALFDIALYMAERGDLGPGDAAHPLTLAIGAGLLIGKPVGIGLSIYMCVKEKWCELAEDVRGRHILGLGLLCGVGFTMALFIGDLAFSDPAMGVYVRMGVLGGSILSALLGYTVLYCCGKRA